MSFKFVDLFAGIGGFHVALHNLGAKCVASCEIDKYARQTYEHNFKEISPELFSSDQFYDDIEQIIPSELPEYDILCAGFPCQPFSQAGYKKGFQEDKDNRGNMFFEVLRLLGENKPRAFFLENVRHLIKHDEGRTFETIKKCIKNLGYSFNPKVVKASDFNLPQHRPRVFMVGFREDIKDRDTFKFPEPIENTYFMTDVFGEPCNKSIGYTLRVGGKSSGINDRRNWDMYTVNGRIRKLTHVEGLKMNGFPEDFTFPVSETQAMKQLGNSVAVNAVEAVAAEILKVLTNDKKG
ncbi:DNA cytosine methyltransferase [bacterium]|nr:DNA cytosine methyltransferase [bacterium]